MSLRNNMSRSAAQPLEWPVRLNSVASIDQPLDAGGPWIVALNQVPKARVSADVAAVLRTVDGTLLPGQVAAALGSQWTAEDVENVVGRLAHTGIFDAGPHRAEVRRVQFRAPLTVQLTLFNPAPLLQALRPALAVLVRRETAAALAIVLVAGLLGLVTASEDIVRVLSTPLPMEAYVFVVAAMFASTLLHELGHGMALTYFGGTPRRIGIMLFYLSPAFFCDVTDGWRLGSRKQRVVIALAGPVVHAALGSLALATHLFLPASPLGDAVLLYGVICFAVAVLNLFPFIKLDGYVALMSWLDVPHLRRKALDALAGVVGYWLLGAPRSNHHQGWLPWFGLAGFVSGAAFTLVGFQRLVPVFLQLGLVGHVVVAAGSCLLLAVVLKIVLAFFGSAARQGSPFWRRAVVVVAGVLCVAALLAAVPVRPTTVAGYTYSDGDLRIVMPTVSGTHSISAGDEVILQTQGMVINLEVARASVGDQPPSNINAPVETVAPVTFPGALVPVLAYPGEMHAFASSTPASGRAVISGGTSVSLGEWLWNAITGSPLWPGSSVSGTDPTKGAP